MHHVNVIRIDNENNLIVSIKMAICRNCKEHMLPRHAGLSNNWNFALRRSNIRIETYQATDICNICLESESITVQCDVCDEEPSFPGEFAYKLMYFSKYDNDTEYKYICKNCIKLRSQEVIEYMAEADEIDEIGEDVSYRSW